MIKEYTISNFKAFSTPATLPIKPITLIYGANSAGKSSIFQSLSLLKDSYDKLTDDDNALQSKIDHDFTSVKHLSHNNSLNEISFFFSFDISDLLWAYNLKDMRDATKNILDKIVKNYKSLGIKNILSFDIDNILYSKEISFYIGDDSSPFISYFSRNEKDDKCNKVKINRMHNFWKEYWTLFGREIACDLLSEVIAYRNSKKCKNTNSIDNYLNKFFNNPYVDIDNINEEELVSFFEDYFFDCKQNKKMNLLDCFKWLKLGFKSGFQIKKYNIFSDGLVNNCYPFQFNAYIVKSFEDILEYFETIKRKDLYSKNFLIFGTIFLIVVEHFLHGELKYIGPFRKFLKNTSELPDEYFDKDYVDKHGEHFSRILINNDQLLNEFNNYLLKLNFEYSMSFFQNGQDEEGRIYHDIVITHNKSKIQTYLSDVGYGISQIFPIIAQCIVSNKDVIAIEQPELHLHPALQAELGDLFIDSAMQKKNTLLIETHSEHILLRIMRRIRETTNGTLPEGVTPIRAEDVSVVYVESVETDGDRHSIIREMPLNDQGELVKAWPGGFFEEGLREVF